MMCGQVIHDGSPERDIQIFQSKLLTDNTINNLGFLPNGTGYSLMRNSPRRRY